MKITKSIYKTKIKFIVPAILIVLFSHQFSEAQTIDKVSVFQSENKIGSEQSGTNDIKDDRLRIGEDFRVEKIQVGNGAEIISVFAKVKDKLKNTTKELPLFSVLRDTLSDDKIENDKLRYVWMLSYTEPSLKQKVAAFVPFLYTRTSNKRKIGDDPPPPVFDLANADKNAWNTIFWFALKSLVISDLRLSVRAASYQYRENSLNYRKAAVSRTLAILSLYEEIEGEKILRKTELQDIQARLMLSDNFLGSFMQRENLERVYHKTIENKLGTRGTNWELLRQYTEAEGLYFEPLNINGDEATHAVVWTTFEDWTTRKNRKTFNSRFLNIKNPWKDMRFARWKGYTEQRWFDEENRPVEAGTPGAKSKTMIPLAVYGLDFPKIPTLLIDFRDKYNPKKREMSRRLLEDLITNILSLSKFGNLPLFVGRFVYDFVTARRGMDINQISRFRSYSQLKLLLALDESLEPEFKNQIANRLEVVSLNPLENDLDAEIKIARKQYENLIAYARRPDGLAAKISRERREEMTPLKHGGKERIALQVGHFLTLGLYKHREKATPELIARMDLRRQLNYHERFLRETARKSAQPEVDSDFEAIKSSLEFIAENGQKAGGKTAQAVAKIFSITEDEQMRELCLNGLYRINNSTAKKELYAIYENTKLNSAWRNLSAEYLKRSLSEEQKISSDLEKMISKIE